MALVTPLLLALMFGCAEMGNYFNDEHYLVKATRDAARYAARIKDFPYYDGKCGATLATTDQVSIDVNALLKTMLLSSGTDRLPNMPANPATVSISCVSSVGGSTPGGIYSANYNNGTTTVVAPVVTVTATVPYTPLYQSFGFKGTGYSLNASQQAAVTAI